MGTNALFANTGQSMFIVTEKELIAAFIHLSEHGACALCGNRKETGSTDTTGQIYVLHSREAAKPHQLVCCSPKCCGKV